MEKRNRDKHKITHEAKWIQTMHRPVVKILKYDGKC